jgi:hypothetical protein
MSNMHGDMELVTIKRAKLWLCSLMLVISYLDILHCGCAGASCAVGQ